MHRPVIFFLLLCIASLSSLAQTGPAGIGNSTRNILWLDASTLPLSNGQNVHEWEGRTNHKNFATQGILSQQPTFISNAINHRAVVRFDGINDFLSIPNRINLNPSTEQTIYIIGSFFSVYLC